MPQMTQNPEYPIVREQLPQWKELSVLSPVIRTLNILAQKEACRADSHDETDQRWAHKENKAMVAGTPVGGWVEVLP